MNSKRFSKGRRSVIQIAAAMIASIAVVSLLATNQQFIAEVFITPTQQPRSHHVNRGSEATNANRRGLAVSERAALGLINVGCNNLTVCNGSGAEELSQTIPAATSDPIDIDIVLEYTDPNRKSWSTLWSGHAAQALERATTSEQQDAVLEEVDDELSTKATWNHLRATLRSIGKHLVCSGGDCCGKHSGIRVRKVTILGFAHAHIPSWIRSDVIGGSCSPELSLLSRADLIAASQPDPDSCTMLNSTNIYLTHSLLRYVPSTSNFMFFAPSSLLLTRDVLWSDLFELRTSKDRRYFVETRVIRSKLVVFSQLGAAVAVASEPTDSPLTARKAFTERLDGGSVVGSEISIPTAGPQMLDRREFARFLERPEFREPLRKLRSEVSFFSTETMMPLYAYALHSLRQSKDRNSSLVRCVSTANITESDLTVVHIRFSSTAQAQKLVDDFTVFSHASPFVTLHNHIHGTPSDEEVVHLAAITSNIAARFADSPMTAFWERDSNATEPIAQASSELVYPREGGGFWDLRPAAVDNVADFPCGYSRARVEGGFLASPGAVDDTVPIPPELASVEEVADQMCWYPVLTTNDQYTALGRNPLRSRVNSAYVNKSRVAAIESNVSVDGRRRFRHPLVHLDVVYTYVRAEGEQWLAGLRKTQEAHGIPYQPNRFRDWEELRYSLRSLNKYLCRNGDCCGLESGMRIHVIYIVVATLEHVPPWMKNYGSGPVTQNATADSNCTPALRFITHDMIFPGAGNNPEYGETVRNDTKLAAYLPNFNSNAIEACLHRIPGLRDHFVYLNNDGLFGRPVHATDFLRPIIIESNATSGDRTVALEPLLFADSASRDARCVNCQVVPISPWRSKRPRSHTASKCTSWPLSPSFNTTLKCKLGRMNDAYTLLIHYNVRLAYERLDGFMPKTTHTHAPRLLHKATRHKMYEVDFRDITEATRAAPFRTPRDIMADYMYIFYASANRAALSRLEPELPCASAPQLDDKVPMNLLYNVWSKFETFNIYNLHRKNSFAMVSNIKEARAWIQHYRDEKHITTFATLNDDVPAKISDTALNDLRAAFVELMETMTSGAPPSPWE